MKLAFRPSVSYRHESALKAYPGAIAVIRGHQWLVTHAKKAAYG